jgi:hypothetical protein
MTTADPRGLVGLILGIAVRRWPPSLRAEQRQEWTAELSMLRDQPRSGWRRLAFVASLAVAPPPEGGGLMRDWRETIPGFARAAGRPLVFVVVAALATFFGAQETGAPDRPPAWVGPVVAISAAIVGLVLGWRSRLRMVGGWPQALGVAGMVTTATALGHLMYRVIAVAVASDYEVHQASIYQGLRANDYEVTRATVASISFVVLLTPVVTLVLGLGSRGRRVMAVSTGAAGLFSALIVARHADIWPFFNRHIEGPYDGAFGANEYTYVLFNPLTVLAALLVAYSLGLSLRRPSVAIVTASSRERGGRPEHLALMVVGWAATSVALLAWVGVVTAPENAWPYELSWGTALLPALSLRLAAVGRRRATLGALILCGWLLAMDVAWQRWVMAEGETGLAIVAAAVGATVAWACAGPNSIRQRSRPRLRSRT